MKPILKFAAYIFLSWIIIFISCKKEYSCENCGSNPPIGGTNKFPIANAGPDQTILLPIDSVILDGSSSSDPDGTISSFQWTKISGPASFIANSSTARAVVKNLAAGIYQFELKVTDNGGLSSKDTAQVTVSDPNLTNRPPVARAGADQTITLPTNSVTIDGSASTDPDNNIISYAWTKISGPSLFNIANANVVQTQVTNLVQGTYQFELKVTDAGSLFSKDTMQIMVNPEPPPPLTCAPGNRPLIPAQLIPFGTLSFSRSSMTIASAGNKILFAGGDDMSNGGEGTRRVDIYDTLTHGWSTAELSISRWNLAAVTCGNKIFFAGGHTNDGNSWAAFSTVDIYDASTDTWSTAQLSERRMDIAVATVGNKIFFAGGTGGDSNNPSFVSNKVDIYDISNNIWSTATLSEARSCITAVTAGNKIYFTGGTTAASGGYGLSCNASNRVDIYENTTGSWTIASRNEALSLTAGIAVGNKIFWAGGEILNCTFPYTHTRSPVVEIRDVNTQTSSFACLFQPNSWPGDRHGNQQTNTVIKDNKIVFFTGEGDVKDKFDIYDVTNNTWSIGTLSFSIQYQAIISINNIIYVADGDQVWKLEF